MCIPTGMVMFTVAQMKDGKKGVRADAGKEREIIVLQGIPMAGRIPIIDHQTPIRTEETVRMPTGTIRTEEIPPMLTVIIRTRLIRAIQGTGEVEQVTITVRDLPLINHANLQVRVNLPGIRVLKRVSNPALKDLPAQGSIISRAAAVGEALPPDHPVLPEADLQHQDLPAGEEDDFLYLLTK